MRSLERGATIVPLRAFRTATITRVDHMRSPDGARLVAVSSGGHTWSGGWPVNSTLGVTTSEYDGMATILALV